MDFLSVCSGWATGLHWQIVDGRRLSGMRVYAIAWGFAGSAVCLRGVNEVWRRKIVC